MKKLLALLLAGLMMLSFAACGNNEDNPSGNEDNPGVSQSGENNNDKGAILVDIADTDIRVWASDYKTLLTGDEAATQKAKIPTEVKKSVGEIGAGLCSVTPDYSGTGSFKFGATFYLSKDSYEEGWKTLTDYYKSLGGTVTLDEKVLSTDKLEIEFSWGELYQCEGYVGEEQGRIVVTFSINTEADSDDSSQQSLWKDTKYAAYTEGLDEPTFKYTIKGVIMDQLTINAEATLDEVEEWKQFLLDSGFEEYREGEQWGIKNATHNIQMNGYVDGVAYIYIGLVG